MWLASSETSTTRPVSYAPLITGPATEEPPNLAFMQAVGTPSMLTPAGLDPGDARPSSGYFPPLSRHLDPCDPRPSSGYFPAQAVVASSPMSGDLHLGSSPARSPAHIAIRACEEEEHTSRHSMFSQDGAKKKASTRPRSDPSEPKRLGHPCESQLTVLLPYLAQFR